MCLYRSVLIILFVITFVATQYDVHVRIPLITKRLEKEGITEEIIQQRLQAATAKPTAPTGYTNLAYGPSKDIDGNFPKGYTHIDDIDYNRYSQIGKSKPRMLSGNKFLVYLQ